MALALALQLLILCEPPSPLCLGPWLGWEQREKRDGDPDTLQASYPKPWLEAQPAAVVAPGVNVTLRCRAPQPAWRFALFRAGEAAPLLLRDVSTELAEFFLEEATPAQGGSYRCCYRRLDWGPGVWSQPSDVLELLVTDLLPRPSLVALPGPVVAPGANVSLRCTGRLPGMSFALYRVGVTLPLQYRHSAQRWADFPLPGARAPGTYSCYYHTPSAPYVLSPRSESLVISSEGLCLGQRDASGDGPLPKPTLSAWPSSVVPTKSNVTLRCSSPIPGVDFVLRKGSATLDTRLPRDAAETTVEFHLTELGPRSAGWYTCECFRRGSPYVTSQASNVLLLLVTGYLPRPSLQAHQAGVVTAGGEVTLQCQMPNTAVAPLVSALLKAGTPSPVQLHRPVGREADFSLRDVTVRDTGTYSCIYYQARPPFWASDPSPSLDILVTGEALRDLEDSIVLGEFLSLFCHFLVCHFS
ncbi:Osteoclast-associated immunoglobulin-like receptor [Sciurus carolinensis]|uniref:Osteoclast-associated immunoglobulin-like receptor n=1 Tax=Sciurus carolinensis TaxID=30640 RepID=A0AA41TCT7_SCICA|nr:Osteoclast-associated immunoglobulin-like receptor [Sciurus carolinensis]